MYQENVSQTMYTLFFCAKHHQCQHLKQSSLHFKRWLKKCKLGHVYIVFLCKTPSISAAPHGSNIHKNMQVYLIQLVLSAQHWPNMVPCRPSMAPTYTKKCSYIRYSWLQVPNMGPISSHIGPTWAQHSPNIPQNMQLYQIQLVSNAQHGPNMVPCRSSMAPTYTKKCSYIRYSWFQVPLKQSSLHFKRW